jgi:quercetin dioxygenase-like cupin family protein
VASSYIQKSPMSATYKLTPGESVVVRHSSPEALEVEGVYAPGGSPPPAHLHPAQDEHFEVLEGELEVHVGGAARTLHAGDTLDIPRGTTHKMWNAGEETARVAWRTSPAGRTLQWFRTLDELQRTGRVGRNGMPGPLAFAAYLTEYRDVFRLSLGPATPLARGALALLAPIGRLRGYRVAGGATQTNSRSSSASNS